MDPDEQIFKECDSLFTYKSVFGVLHKKFTINSELLMKEKPGLINDKPPLSICMVK